MRSAWRRSRRQARGRDGVAGDGPCGVCGPVSSPEAGVAAVEAGQGDPALGKAWQSQQDAGLMCATGSGRAEHVGALAERKEREEGRGAGRQRNRYRRVGGHLSAPDASLEIYEQRPNEEPVHQVVGDVAEQLPVRSIQHEIPRWREQLLWSKLAHKQRLLEALLDKQQASPGALAGPAPFAIPEADLCAPPYRELDSPRTVNSNVLNWDLGFEACRAPGSPRESRKQGDSPRSPLGDSFRCDSSKTTSEVQKSCQPHTPKAYERRSRGMSGDVEEKSNLLIAEAASDVNAQYHLGPELGTGHSGVVRVCKEKGTGERLACKSVAKTKLQDPRSVKELRSEVTAMREIGVHPGTVQLVDLLEDAESVHLIMPLCSKGDLFDHLAEKERLSELEVAHIVGQTASALQFAHDRDYAHRDVKPENILITGFKSVFSGAEVIQVPQVKLADWGLAHRVATNQRIRGVVGSTIYMAPEVFSAEHGKEADIWSLGVTLYVALAGYLPFWGDSTEETLVDIMRGRPDYWRQPWPLISSEAKDLCRSMLDRNPSKRATASEVLKHPWIRRHFTKPVPTLHIPGSLRQISPKIWSPEDRCNSQSPRSPPTFSPMVSSPALAIPPPSPHHGEQLRVSSFSSHNKNTQNDSEQTSELSFTSLPAKQSCLEGQVDVAGFSKRPPTLKMPPAGSGALYSQHSGGYSSHGASASSWPCSPGIGGSPVTPLDMRGFFGRANAGRDVTQPIVVKA